MAATAAVAVAWPAYAAKWDITPSAAVEENFTDNLGLRKDSEDRNSDLTTTVTPAIAVHGSGGRINLDGAYSFSKVMNLHATDQNSYRNSLNANGTAELWEKQLFFDTSAQISEQIANPQAPTSQSSSNAGVNSLETTTWTAGPRFLHHLGPWAETTSILTRTGVSTRNPSGSINGATSGTVTGSQAVGNSTITTSSFEARSGRRFTQFLWTVTAHDIMTSYEDRPHHNDKLGRADVTYVVNRQVSLNGGGGLQIINDDTLTTSPTGPIWSIGASYRPGPRLTLQVAYNSQFNEEFFTYNGTYAISPRTSLSFSHTETISTTAQLLARRTPIFDPLTGRFVDPVTGLPVDPNVAPTGLQNDTLLQKAWNATFSTSSGRNRYSMNLNRTSSNAQQSGQTTTQTGIVLTYARTLTHRLNGSLSANYRVTDSSNGTNASGTTTTTTATTANGHSTSVLMSGTLGYTLTKETTLNFNLNYSAFNGGDETVNEHEKSASLILKRTF